MSFIERLENQAYGYRLLRDINFVLKDFYGFCENSSELCNSPIFSCRFAPLQNYQDIVALANEDGKIEIRNTASNLPGTINQAHNNAIFDIAWTPKSTKLISASGDYTARLWDVNSSSIQSLLTFTGHVRSLKSISCNPYSDDIFATGSRDGNILLWDCRTADATSTVVSDNVIHFGNKHPSPSVTSVAYIDDYYLISAMANDGILRVWDTRRSYTALRKLPTPVSQIAHPDQSKKNAAYSCITVDPCYSRIYANSTNNVIYSYSFYNHDFTLCSEYTGHVLNSFYIRHSVSRDGRYIVSGSGDGSAYLWAADVPGKPIWSLQGHLAEVTAADWSYGAEMKLATCSDDSTYMLWKLHPHEKSDVIPEVKGHCEPITAWYRKTKKINLTCKIGCKKAKPVDVLSPVKRTPTKLCISPMKSPGRLVKRLKLSPSKAAPELLMSPTDNLPNYVLDGVSPHQHRCSRRLQLSNTPDWLTKLRKSVTPKCIVPSGNSPSQHHISTPSPSSGSGRKKRRRSSTKKLDSFFKFATPRGKPKSLNFNNLPHPQESL